jgi:hypothetical protein
MRMMRKGCLVFGGLFLLLLALSQGLPQVVTVLAGQPGQVSYTVVGPPTISATFMDQVLAAYHSPAVRLGSVIAEQGVRYGIDPVYALAFFWHESAFGSTGEARVTRSPGNERCIADRPCIDQDRGGYALMNSWADGFEHWFRLIRGLYINTWGRTTVEQIIPKYAPNSDGNDETAYIAAVEHAVDVWRSGKLWV